MSKTQRTTLAILIAVSLVGAAIILAHRIRVEGANRTVAIAVDYDRCQQLAAQAGSSTAAFLRRLKSTGVTHVAITEESLADLLQSGRVRLEPSGGMTTLVPCADVRERVLAQLGERVPGGVAVATPEPGLRYRDPALPAKLQTLGVGYSEGAVRDAEAARLEIVARPLAEGVVTRRAVDAALDAAASVKAQIVIFSGTQVMGVDKLLDYTAKGLQRRGLLFGFVEMAKQTGELSLAEATECRLIRCHALAIPEMAKITPEKAVDRFRLAVRERNVRLCYVRPYALASDDPLSAAMDHTQRITQAVLKAGLRTGRPEPFVELRVSKVLLALCLMGAGAGFIWLLALSFGLSSGVFTGLLIAEVLLSLAAAFGATGIAQDLGALGAAVVFPLLALASLHLPDAAGKPSLVSGIRLFLRVSGISLIGGLLIAACLSDTPHMVQAEVFRGVKLAQLLPLFVLLLIWAGRCTKSYQDVRTELGEHAPDWPALRPGLGEALGAFVRYWHAALILLGLIMLAVMVVRSGNTTPVPPSDLEIKVRSTLEHMLVIRPRTKEILLGHPALVLSLSLLAVGWRRGLWIGILLGAIGQVSLVNTFGHIHTPLWITLVRVGHGLWIGLVVAWVLWPLLTRLLRRCGCWPG